MSQRQIELHKVSLEDKYRLLRGQIYLTGVQALVKLPLVQRELDRASGLNTAGFITGYRGSPLGTYDQQLWKAAEFLKEQNVRFVPGVNEELAATAVWGTQQLAFEPGSQVDGVFGIWYAKSPGVDRAMDAIRHGNTAGSSPHGGVLLLLGDDHPGRSATVPNQSELDMISAAVPVLNPASIEDYIRLGVHGIAMSRFSGCWVGMVVLAETVDGAASINFDLDSLRPAIPEGRINGARNIRWPDPHVAAEQRLHEMKLPAVLDYARVNKLNRTLFGSADARLGIATTGKAYLDVCEALTELGLNDEAAVAAGIRLMKIDLIWPLEPLSARVFSAGLREILVVEEKRPTLETQFRDLLFNDAERPKIVGKTTGMSIWEAHASDSLLQVKGELSPGIIAQAIAWRLLELGVSEQLGAQLRDRLVAIEAAERASTRPRMHAIASSASAILTQGARTPSYCSGCPHNTSTKVPEGSKAMAGIGCHFMAQWIYPESTAPFTQMGGEGAAWVGQFLFTSTPHMFVNLGDGTFYHSGILAIRQAIASKANVTYKILYNDAVAMTGGQPVDGTMPVSSMATVLLAEGCRRVVVVGDEVEKYTGQLTLPPGVQAFDRSRLDEIQRELRDTKGCTAIIYDQTCAAEKRRRRKSKALVDPARRVVINPAVCEACGDCSNVSNCLSIVPLETALGRKRAIDQSSCNKDFRCIEGFCPSFVTIEGGSLRKPAPAGLAVVDLPEPPEPSWVAEDDYGILIAGVGGSGVVTVGALVGMAAHLEGKGVSVLDMTGLAQKGGAVFSHIRLSSSRNVKHAARIRAADLVLGCDVGTTVEPEPLAALRRGRTRVITSTAEAATGSLARNPDVPYAGPAALGELRQRIGDAAVETVPAAEAALELLGDAIQANVLLLGYAWQRGRIPLSRAALLRAIELNGVAVTTTKQAFEYGRLLAAAPETLASRSRGREAPVPKTVDEVIAHRSKLLTDYQDSALARRYESLVKRVRQAESKRLPGSESLTAAVARYYYKVLAVKDEYEVARLHSAPEFLASIEQQFEGDYKLNYHLAPPALARRDAAGHLKKRAFGPWMGTAFKLLAKGRRLRNTALDPFRRTPERREEAGLAKTYEGYVETVLEHLNDANIDACQQLLEIPEHIRGFGHIRHAAIKRSEPVATRLQAEITMFRHSSNQPTAETR